MPSPAFDAAVANAGLRRAATLPVTEPQNIEEENYNTAAFGQDPLTRGYQSGVRGLSGATRTYLAAALEAAGQKNAAQHIYDDVAQDQYNARGAEPYVPQWKDAHDLGSAVNYGAGQIGQLIPQVVPAFVGGGVARALRAGPIGSYLAGTAPLYPSIAGGAVERMRADPVTAQLSPQERFRTATLEGAGETALYGAVPWAMQGRAFGEGALRAAVPRTPLAAAGAMARDTALGGAGFAGANLAVGETGRAVQRSYNPAYQPEGGDAAAREEELASGLFGGAALGAPHAVLAHTLGAAAKPAADIVARGAQAAPGIAADAASAGAAGAKELFRGAGEAMPGSLEEAAIGAGKLASKVTGAAADVKDKALDALDRVVNKTRDPDVDTLLKPQTDRQPADLEADDTAKHAAAQRIAAQVDSTPGAPLDVRAAAERYMQGPKTADSWQEFADTLRQWKRDGTVSSVLDSINDELQKTIKGFRAGMEGGSKNAQLTDPFDRLLAETLAAHTGSTTEALRAASLMRKWIETWKTPEPYVPHSLRELADDPVATVKGAYTLMKKQGLVDNDAALTHVVSELQNRSEASKHEAAVVEDNLLPTAQAEHQFSGEDHQRIATAIKQQIANGKLNEPTLDALFGPNKERVLEALRRQMPEKRSDEGSSRAAASLDSDEHMGEERDAAPSELSGQTDPMHPNVMGPEVKWHHYKEPLEAVHDAEGKLVKPAVEGKPYSVGGRIENIDKETGEITQTGTHELHAAERAKELRNEHGSAIKKQGYLDYLAEKYRDNPELLRQKSVDFVREHMGELTPEEMPKADKLINQRHYVLREEKFDNAEKLNIPGSEFDVISTRSRNNKWGKSTGLGNTGGTPKEHTVWFEKADGTPFAVDTRSIIGRMRNAKKAGEFASDEYGLPQQKTMLLAGISSILNAKKNGENVIKRVGVLDKRGPTENVRWLTGKDLPDALNLFDGTLKDAQVEHERQRFEEMRRTLKEADQEDVADSGDKKKIEAAYNKLQAEREGAKLAEPTRVTKYKNRETGNEVTELNPIHETAGPIGERTVAPNDEGQLRGARREHHGISEGEEMSAGKKEGKREYDESTREELHPRPTKNDAVVTPAKPDEKHVDFMKDVLDRGMPAFNAMLAKATPEQRAAIQSTLKQMVEAKSPDAPLWRGKPPKDFEAFAKRARQALEKLDPTWKPGEPQTAAGGGEASALAKEQGVPFSKVKDKPANVAPGTKVDSNVFRASGGKSALATPISQHDAGKAADAVTMHWSKDAPKVEFASTFSSLPKELQDAVKQKDPTGKDTKGFYHPDTNSIWVLLDKHATRLDVEKTLYHEGGHYGTLVELGKDSIAALDRSFDKLGVPAMSAIAKEHGFEKQFAKDLAEFNSSKKTALDRATLLQELIAGVAQEKPFRSWPQKLRDAALAVVGAIRNWLKANGYDELGKLNEADVLHLVDRGNDRLFTGGMNAKGLPAFLHRMSTAIHEDLGKEGFAATHDSPIRHEGKFDWRAHQGKGEGNAAFGAGTYLSTAEGVHRQYKRAFTAKAHELQPDKNRDALVRELSNAWDAYAENNSSSTKAQLGAARLALDKYDETHASPTYSVTVRAKPEEMMDWNKPLSEQSDYVRDILENDPLLRAQARKFGEDMSKYPGSAMYSVIAHALSKDGRKPDFAAASNYLQESGIVGHTYDAAAGKESKFRNHVIYDDSRIETNYVEFNRQKPTLDSERRATPEELKAANDYLDKTLGPQMRREFTEGLGGHSADWTPEAQGNIIRVATNAVGGVYTNAVHESMHEFWDRLRSSQQGSVEKLLHQVTSNEIVVRSLERILRDYPEAAASVRKDPSEALAYAYQFWEAGHPELKLGDKAQGFFAKVAKFFRKVTGLLRDDEKVEALFREFKEGKLQDASVAGKVLDKLNNSERRVAAVVKTMEPFRRAALDWVGSAESNLNTHHDKNIQWVGKEFTEHNDGYLAASDRNEKQWMSKLKTVLSKHDPDDIRSAVDDLQKGTLSPDAKIAAVQKDVRTFLDEMYPYLKEAGVSVMDDAGAWNVIQKIKNYFPRSWDMERLSANGNDFVDRLLKYHTKELTAIAKQANKEQLEGGTPDKGLASSKIKDREITAEDIASSIYHRLTLSNGQEDLTEDGYSLGYSPMMKAVNRRSLDWIDMSKFHDFQNKDIANILSTYVMQGVKRAEYTRRFGPDGAKIEARMQLATEGELGRIVEDKYGVKDAAGKARGMISAMKGMKQDAPSFEAALTRVINDNLTGDKRIGEADVLKLLDRASKQLAPQRRAVMAMEGTLGHDIDPTLRKAQGWVLAYQNWRMLPMALFSNLIDPLGMMVRGGTMDDTFKGYKNALTDVINSWRGKERDDNLTHMAEAAGVLDAHGYMSSMGSMMNSIYMSGGAKRMNDALFRINGMEALNRSMRTSATGAAIGFIKRHATAPNEHSTRLLDELHLDADYVKKHLDEKNGLDVQDPRIQRAIAQWVNEAILRPNSALRPSRMSDPHWALFSHFKGFMYAMKKQIIDRAVKEARYGNYTAASTLALGYVPVMFAADLTKLIIQNGIAGNAKLPAWWEGMDAKDHAEYAAERAGLLGPAQMVRDAFEYGPSAMAGPTAEQMTSLFTQPFGKSVQDALPWSQFFASAQRAVND